MKTDRTSSKPRPATPLKGPDPFNDASEIIPAIYDDGKRLARAKRRATRMNHTLDTIEVLDAALAKVILGRQSYAARGQRLFWYQLKRAIPQILQDHDRKKKAAKRGGGKRPLELDRAEAGTPAEDPSVGEMHELLLRMSEEEPKLFQVLHLYYERCLTQEGIAKGLGLDRKTVQANLVRGRIWLRNRLSS